MTPQLLFVEDDEDILATLYAWFEPLGFGLDCARNGQAALNMALIGHFDCIALDIMLPGLDGFNFCAKLREAGDTTPIIMLTAKDSIDDRVHGLELGADDYLIKPFSLKELEARVRALLRRPRPMASCILGFSELKLDTGQRRAFRNETEIKLSPALFRILELLMRNAPNIVTRQELESMLWGDDPPGPTALRNHILELRRQLDKPFPCPMLETLPHVGYRLRNAQA